MDKNKYMKAGLLAEKRSVLTQLEVKADRCVKEINVKLFSSDGIRGIEMEAARQAFGELEGAIGLWNTTTQEIKNIEGGL